MVTVPYLVGCASILVEPLPAPAARPATAIRGVILASSGERIDYRRTEFVIWTDSTLAITGIVPAESQNVTTRTYLLSDLEAVLVRRIDVNQTSLFIAVVMVGVAALSAILVTGKTTDETIFATGN